MAIEIYKRYRFILNACDHVLVRVLSQNPDGSFKCEAVADSTDSPPLYYQETILDLDADELVDRSDPVTKYEARVTRKIVAQEFVKFGSLNGCFIVLADNTGFALKVNFDSEPVGDIPKSVHGVPIQIEVGGSKKQD